MPNIHRNNPNGGGVPTFRNDHANDIVKQLRQQADDTIDDVRAALFADAAAEIEQLRSRMHLTIEAVRNSYSEYIYIPYTLSKAIAKRDITFENLTAEKWFEIYSWFYKNRYDEFPRSDQLESGTDALRRDLPA